MKLVGYVRVSTDRQVEDGLGLDVQERELRSWAREHGHRIVELIRDEGVSGASELDNRPGLADAMLLLRERRAEGIVVVRLDRLARDLIVQETLLGELRRLGATVLSAAGGEAAYLEDDPKDPSRRLIRQVLGAVAEYERAMIALRLRAGRERKAELGGYAHGAPPLGYRAEDGELVVDPEEARTLDRIVELRDAGASLRAMARTLTAEGFEPKRATRWHPEVLRRILARLEGDTGSEEVAA